MEPVITQASLLSRVRDPANQTAWSEFDAKYRELILRFCRRRGLQDADAEDVLQLSMQFLVRSLPQFIYDPKRGRFRDYLYQTVRSALSRRSKKPSEHGLDTSMAANLADESDPESASQWEREWMDHHSRLAVENIKQTFDKRSVEVFLHLLRGSSVDEAAAAFQMNADAVYKIRQRVRARMEELVAQQIREEDAVDG